MCRRAVLCSGGGLGSAQRGDWLLFRCFLTLEATTMFGEGYVCSGVCAMVGPGWVQHNGLIGFLGRCVISH